MKFEEIQNLNAALGLGEKYLRHPSCPDAVVKYQYLTLSMVFSQKEFVNFEKNATDAEAIFKKKQFLIEKELSAIEECQRALSDRHYELRKKLESLKA